MNNLNIMKMIMNQILSRKNNLKMNLNKIFNNPLCKIFKNKNNYSLNLKNNHCLALCPQKSLKNIINHNFKAKMKQNRICRNKMMIILY